MDLKNKDISYWKAQHLSLLILQVSSQSSSNYEPKYNILYHGELQVEAEAHLQRSRAQRHYGDVWGRVFRTSRG